VPGVRNQCRKYKQQPVATEQKQVKLEIVRTTAAGTCFVTGSGTMSTDQDLIPGQLGDFHKIVKERFPRGPYKFFIQEPPKSAQKSFL
jgi:hypothetical protein